MKKINHFIVIDDDRINNLLCSIVIGKVASGLDVIAFEVAERGLDYIAKSYLNSNNPTVLFLDINMPTWSGWDFLKKYEELDQQIRKQIEIYMLSSSVDGNDMQRARENEHVVDYIVKPLSEKTVSSILNGQGLENSKVLA